MYVNKLNCRIWCIETPYVTAERPLHPQIFTLWCIIRSDGVIGPHFSENREDVTETVYSHRYNQNITDVVGPEINDRGNGRDYVSVRCCIKPRLSRKIPTMRFKLATKVL